jgi:thymidylate synthase
MYLPITPQPSNARAWVAAATAVQDAGGEAHNVIIDVADPVAEDSTDTAIIQVVDRYLRGHNTYSIATVANTIFPESTLRRYGPVDFYDAYHQRVLPRTKRITRDWGRYFERLTKWTKIRNGQISTINPLQDLITFMQAQIAGQRTYRNVYEMAIYDPTRDAGKVSNRQCLSFLSFKLMSDHQLLLTAVYRNHAYISRGLGNFIGLGRLQAFVAQQCGAKVGSLTCVSTHAEIDNFKNNRMGTTEGWSKREADELESVLLGECFVPQIPLMKIHDYGTALCFLQLSKHRIAL